MRLFAISDIHTDYKENLAWVIEHAGAARADKEARGCGQTDDQGETVLLVAGDVCDDVEQFRKVG